MNLDQAMQQPQSTTLTTSAGNYTDRDRALINHLFKRLTAIYPAWKLAFPTEESVKEAKRAWIDAFINNGMSDPEYLIEGVKFCERDQQPYLPSVGQFMEWCRLGMMQKERESHLRDCAIRAEREKRHYETQHIYPQKTSYYQRMLDNLLQG